ncbi:MAG: 4-hydroxyphenylacetate 3-hydroxylase N-terminal domain-containing protein [Acidiferrobacterales bacterium]
MLRSGDKYHESLRDGRQAWLNGEKGKNIPTHAAFKLIVDARARIYDMAHEDSYRRVLSYVDETTNEPNCIAYRPPTTREDRHAKRCADAGRLRATAKRTNDA